MNAIWKAVKEEISILSPLIYSHLELAEGGFLEGRIFTIVFPVNTKWPKWNISLCEQNKAIIAHVLKQLSGYDIYVQFRETGGIPEPEIIPRRLRAAIYGECTDHNWDECKKNWMTPSNTRWLQEHQPKSRVDVNGNGR